MYGDRSPRERLIELSHSYDYMIDARSGEDAPLTLGNMLQYKYQIDIDGMANSWDGFFWKLYSNSLVFKVTSHWEQWFYKDLKPWVHYIPVTYDLSDLLEKLEWAIQNDDECKRIAENGRRFAMDLTYEYAVSKYNPFEHYTQQQQTCNELYNN
jgi:hypothetical protein